jgi:hypothetical protein
MAQLNSLGEWIHPLNDLKLMSQVTLHKNHISEDVRKSLSFMKKIVLTQPPDEIGFDEYC